MGVYSRRNIWYIDYYVSGKRVRETIGPNKKLAESILRKRLVEVTENKNLDIHRQKKVRFEEFANTFLELHSKPNKKSWKSDFFNLNSLRRFFGGRYLYSITQRDIEENGDKREIPMNSLVEKALIGVRKHSESPYVFCKKDGSTYTNIKKSFLATLSKCGIIEFRFHDLRHTFASQLVMSGIDLNTVRELMGHRDIKMTLRYAHLSPDHKRRAVEVLGQNIVTNWSQGPKVSETEKIDELQPIGIN